MPCRELEVYVTSLMIRQSFQISGGSAPKAAVDTAIYDAFARVNRPLSFL
ncbi:hypothetical protein GCM10025859_47110 [Alicyclobacillus fastidiosus]|nr:hypothetical protein GCM10025859_47110 [Alicyclobacillus fastidiosus]